MKAVDPMWKGKKVLWKDVKENKDITLAIIEELFADKIKAAPAKIVDSGQINMNKLRTFFS